MYYDHPVDNVLFLGMTNFFQSVLRAPKMVLTEDAYMREKLVV